VFCPLLARSRAFNCRTRSLSGRTAPSAEARPSSATPTTAWRARTRG